MTSYGDVITLLPASASPRRGRGLATATTAAAPARKPRPPPPRSSAAPAKKKAARRRRRPQKKKSPPPRIVRITSGPPPPPENFLYPKNQIVSTCATSGAASLTLSADKTSSVTWKGWGTSLSWFAYYIGKLPKDKLDAILDLLFSRSKGLGLNIIRYNIGASTNLSISIQFNRTDELRFRVMPGFKATATSPMDWTQDWEQRKVLFGARDRGADTFIAYANSPPWWMTVSGDTAGNAKPGVNNLRDSYVQDFVDYLADVVEQYKKDPKWDLEFDFLEPVNEPDELYWKKGNNQEGCFVSPSQMGSILTRSIAAMASRKLSTKLVAADVWARKSPAQFAATSGDVMPKLAGFHVHGYVSPGTKGGGAAAEAAYTASQQFGEQWGKEVWVSEWGPMYADGSDLGIALFMGRQIIESINIMKASAWCYWQPVDAYFVWSLVNITAWDPNLPLTYVFSKKYFILQHFTRSVVPGSVAFDTSISDIDCEHGIAAFYSPTSSSISIHIVNMQTSARSVTINVQDYLQSELSLPVDFQLRRTSIGEDFKRIESPEGSLEDPFSIDCVGQSFTTLVITNVAPAVQVGKNRKRML